MTDTRDRLVRATRTCIATKGLSGTTSREITAEAGANLAAITYHFGSKERLVGEALLEALRRWLEPSLGVLEGDGDPAARALAAVRLLLETFEAHREEAPTFLQALVEAPRMPSLRNGVVDLWAELRQLLAGQLRELQQRGAVGPWVDPEAMSALLIAVANGLVLQVTVDPDGPRLEAMAGQFAALLLAVRQA